MNVVLDTSVFVSGLLKPLGVPAQVPDAWRARRFQLVTSPAIVEEVRGTMSYPRIRRRYPVAEEDIESLVELLLTTATVVPGVAYAGDAPLREPKDEIILAAAADAEADVLVTSDQDLLVLGTYRQTRIVTPRQFLRDYGFEEDAGDAAP